MDSSLIVSVTAFLTLVSHVALGLFVLGLLLKVSFVRDVRSFVARRATLLSLVVTTSALVGSLLYSEVLGFDPCVLCWIQRIFIYPQVILLAIALWVKEQKMTTYLLGLTIPGAFVALYHAYTNLGGRSFTPCTAAGGSCSTLYIWKYGYITIPMMAFTTFVYLVVIELCRRYESKQKKSEYSSAR